MTEPSPRLRPAARQNSQSGFLPPRPVNPSPARRQPLTLVRSAGNVGSAVARAIHQAHLPVVLLQDREMTTLRWRMAFAPALSGGISDLEGVSARRARLEQASRLAQHERGVIPLVVASMRAAIGELMPTVIVDARIKGEQEPTDLRGQAPLTIGIGPRFSGGEDVDLVIESAWGAELGAVIAWGRAQCHPCEPEIIDGLSWERFARVPKAGIFRTDCKIGDTVRRRSVVGRIGDLPVTTPISGTIRGLIPDGVKVRRGEKFVEIDPRLSNAHYTGVAERPARIAAGVLNAIRAKWPSQGNLNNEEKETELFSVC